MRIPFTFAILLAASAAALANGLHMAPNGPSDAQVQAARDSLEPAVMAMKGVVLFGVTACVQSTGVPFMELPENQIDSNVFVNCFEIGTADDASTSALKALYPPGSKYQGIYVHIVETGAIHPA